MLINIPDPVVKEYFVKSLADLEKRHGRFYVYDTGDYPPFSAYSLLLQKYLPSDTPETKTNAVFSREQRLRQLCESETPHMRLDPSSETLHMLCEHIPEDPCNKIGSLLGRLLLVVSIRKQQDKMSEFEFNNPVSETNDLVWQSIVTFCGRVKPLVSDEVISIIEQNWPEAKKTVLALLINSGALFGAERGPLDLKGWGDLSRINFSNQVLPVVDSRTKIVPPNEPLETTLARFQGVPTNKLTAMIEQLTPRLAKMIEPLTTRIVMVPWIGKTQTDVLQQVLEQRRLEESKCAYLPTEPTGLILPEPQRIQYASANDLFGAYDAFGQMDFDALRDCAALAGTPIIEGRRPGGDFSQQNLIGAYICAGLQKGDLSRINAVDAVFRYTDLREANLSHGDFSGAVFYDVDFCGADLTGANFENARFINCRMGPLQDKAMDAKWANLNIHYMHQCTWDGPIDLRGTTISGMFSHSILHQLDMQEADVNNLIFVATLADTLHFSETATNIEIAHSSRVHATHPNPCEIYVDETSDHQESLIYIPHVSERGLIIPNLLDSESIGCPWRGDLHNHPDVPWSPHFQDPRFASLWNKLGFSL